MIHMRDTLELQKIIIGWALVLPEVNYTLLLSSIEIELRNQAHLGLRTHMFYMLAWTEHMQHPRQCSCFQVHHISFTLISMWLISLWHIIEWAEDQPNSYVRAKLILDPVSDNASIVCVEYTSPRVTDASNNLIFTKMVSSNMSEVACLRYEASTGVKPTAYVQIADETKSLTPGMETSLPKVSAFI